MAANQYCRVYIRGTMRAVERIAIRVSWVTFTAKALHSTLQVVHSITSKNHMLGHGWLRA